MLLFDGLTIFDAVFTTSSRRVSSEDDDRLAFDRDRSTSFPYDVFVRADKGREGGVELRPDLRVEVVDSVSDE